MQRINQRVRWALMSGTWVLALLMAVGAGWKR